MYYLIYKTTNKINGKYYIGMHKTNNIDDDYIGSGTYFRKALKKYGRENFEREILEFCNSEEEMRKAEIRYITEDVVNDKNSYNLKLGGSGGWDYVNKILTDSERKRITKIALDGFKEKFKDPVWRERYCQNMKKIFSSEAIKNKMSKEQKEYFKTPPGTWTGKHHTEKSKKKIGEANSKSQRGIKNSQYGTCWISNTLIKKSIKINKEFLFEYIIEGWIKKRIIKWRN